METTHRPDFQALSRELQQECRSGSKFTKAYMFPYINIEDLTKPKTLLLLFESRGHNTPDTFVNTDFNSIHVRHISDAITPAYLNGYTRKVH